MSVTCRTLPSHSDHKLPNPENQKNENVCIVTDDTNDPLALSHGLDHVASIHLPHRGSINLHLLQPLKYVFVVHVQRKREIKSHISFAFHDNVSVWKKRCEHQVVFSRSSTSGSARSLMVLSSDIAIPSKKYFRTNYTVVLQSGRHTCGYCRDGTTTGPDDMIQ